MSELCSPPTATDAQLQASTTPMGQELSLLAAHLLLHILEIDRRHALQDAHGVNTRTVRKA